MRARDLIRGLSVVEQQHHRCTRSWCVRGAAWPSTLRTLFCWRISLSGGRSVIPKLQFLHVLCRFVCLAGCLGVALFGHSLNGMAVDVADIILLEDLVVRSVPALAVCLPSFAVFLLRGRVLMLAFAAGLLSGRGRLVYCSCCAILCLSFLVLALRCPKFAQSAW